jgi:hypothetical protein
VAYIAIHFGQYMDPVVVLNEIRSGNSSLPRDTAFTADTFPVRCIGRARPRIAEIVTDILVAGANFAILAKVSSNLALLRHERFRRTDFSPFIYGMKSVLLHRIVRQLDLSRLHVRRIITTPARSAGLARLAFNTDIAMVQSGA